MSDHWLIKPNVARQQLAISYLMINKLKSHLLMVVTPRNFRLYVRAYHEELLHFLNGRDASIFLVQTFAASDNALRIANEQREYFNQLVASKTRKDRLSTRAICEILNVSENVVSEWVQSGKLTPQREFGRGNPQTYSVEGFVQSCHVVGPGER